jgi:hypothetical protein
VIGVEAMDEEEPRGSKLPEVSIRNGPPPGLSVRTPGALGQLWANLRAGFRLLFFVPVGREHFHFSLDQAALLLIVAIATTVTTDYLYVDPIRIFNEAGIGYVAKVLLFGLLGCYLVSKIERQSGGFLNTVVTIYSVAPASALVWIVFEYLFRNQDAEIDASVGLVVASVLVMLWLSVAMLRAVRVVYGRGLFRSGCLALLIIVVETPIAFHDTQQLWVTRGVPGALSAVDQTAYLDVERTYYDQSHIFDRSFDALEPNRPGVVDLYFVGFGSYAHQDVFLREVRSVRELFDERFDTAGRSLALINNQATVEDLPLASVTNLWWALSELPKVMDAEEDVTFLFLTSHGSEDFRLSVDFWPLGLNDLSAEELDSLLDDAGIKWRVIVVSACYSGGFIDALKDDNSLIMTASRSDRTSFGCDHKRDYTYFGEAYFDQQLRSEVSFIKAFHKAANAIAARELAEGLTASEPQIHVGAEIEAKLEVLENRLRGLQAPSSGQAAAQP